MNRGIEKCFISVRYGNLIPLFFYCAAKVDISEFAALIKCTVSNGSNTIRDVCTGEAAASIKCTGANTGNAWFNGSRNNLTAIRMPRCVVAVVRIIIHVPRAGDSQHTVLAECPGQIFAASAGSNRNIMNSGIEKCFISFCDGNLIPLFFCCTAKIDIGEAAAQGKCTVANTGNTIRNGHTGEAAATFKSTGTNACNALQNGYAGEVAAFRKCIIANACNTIWNGYAGKVAALIKCTVANGANTIRDGHTGEAAASIKCRVANGGNAFWNGHAGKAAASVKCSFTNAGNAFWNSHIGKVAASHKCPIANGGNSWFHGNGSNLFFVLIPRCIDTGRIVPHGSRAGDSQGSVLAERPGQVLAASVERNRNIMNRGIEKRVIFIRYGNLFPLFFCAIEIYICEFAAPGKCPFANAGNTIGDGHTGEAGASNK